MVAPRYRSRTFRRVKVKTPGGEVKVHFRKRKPSKARCHSCGDVLKGVLNERPYKIQNVSRTKKRPSRPYGGVLCSRCMKEKVILEWAK